MDPCAWAALCAHCIFFVISMQLDFGNLSSRPVSWLTLTCNYCLSNARLSLWWPGHTSILMWQQWCVIKLLCFRKTMTKKMNFTFNFRFLALTWISRFISVDIPLYLSEMNFTFDVHWMNQTNLNSCFANGPKHEIHVSYQRICQTKWISRLANGSTTWKQAKQSEFHVLPRRWI